MPDSDKEAVERFIEMAMEQLDTAYEELRSSEQLRAVMDAVAGTDLVTSTSGLGPILTGTSARPHASHYWRRRRRGGDGLHCTVYGGLDLGQPLLN